MNITEEQLKAILIKNGLVDEQKFNEIASAAKNADVKVEDAVIENDIVSDEQLGLLVADSFKFPYVILSKISIPEDVYRIVPERVARKFKVIPFARDAEGIKLAMVDPSDTQIREMVTLKTGQKVIPHYATERDIYNALHMYRRDLQKIFDILLKRDEKNAQAGYVYGSPAAKIVDLMIDYAYQDKASDVHIEPQETESLVRYRIDGILHDIVHLPKVLHEQIISKIKVMSRLRTDEHLAPQDGKMRFKLEEEDLDIRVSIIPIVEGEKVVMRLLASHYRQFSLKDLGMTDKDLTKVQRGITKSFGMVLSTGPTGSGKSTSIYALLKILNKREKNITTIEDPVEYRLKGINQIHVNPKTNLTFASGLRSILRQDPNIIFVGEIRDNETAGIAVNAALTGHLVLSTLHTNDAATAIPRFIDMKVEPFLVASTINVIIAQRLLRKICDMCKTAIDISRDELSTNFPEDVITRNFGDKKSIRIYHGAGCRICHNTGYAGRVGVFEVLEVTKDIRQLITEGKDSDVIIEKAVENGMTTMLDDGLMKVLKGNTTMEEVLRVTKVDF